MGEEKLAALNPVAEERWRAEDGLRATLAAEKQAALKGAAEARQALEVCKPVKYDVHTKHSFDTKHLLVS